jgi:alkanesulfonate monooxygenase SsuD/methylene tetrahydromethanopterin reductase-like flavin-dependent oxidoreductase (luciferase family)
VGGNGPRLTFPCAVRYADEWNGVYLSPGEFSRLNARLDEMLQAGGRSPQSLRRSVMTGCEFGKDEATVRRRVSQRTGGRKTPEELRAKGLIAGTAPEVVEQLGRLSEAGVQRVMLQWLDLDYLDGLEALAAGVLPQVKQKG